jgi:MFS family permease
MRAKYPRFFDGLVWPAVILGDAVLLLNAPTTSFLAIQKMGAKHHDLAIISAAGSLVYALCCPIAAAIGARVGKRRMFLAGMVVYATWGLALSQAGSIAQLALCQAYMGLGGAILWPNLEAELSRGREGPLLRKRLSIFNAMWCVGTVLGPFAGIWLYPKQAVALGAGGRAAINTAYYASVLLGASALTLLWLWRVRIPEPREAASEAGYEAPHDPARLKAFRMMAYVGNFMCYMVLGVLRNLYEALAKHQWAHQEAATIYFWLLVDLAASGTAMFVALYFLHRWSYRLKRHLGSQAAMGAAMLLVALSSNVAWLALAFMVIGLASSFTYSGSLFYSIEGKDESSHMAGWHEAVLGAGGACGLLVSGFMPMLMERFGVGEYWLMRSPYLLTTALFAVGIVVQASIYLSHRPKFTPAAAA